MTGFNGMEGWLGSVSGKVILTLAGAFPFVFAMAAAAGAAEMVYYQINYNGRGVSTEVVVNGVPVSQSSFETSGMGSMALNVWLKPEKNTVSVRVKAIPNYKDSDVYYTFGINKAKRGQYSDEGEKLAGFEWKLGESKEKLPLEKKFELTPKPPITLDLWTKTEILTMNSETEKSAREFLKSLYDAYAKGDVEKFWSMTEFKNMEQVRALAPAPMTAAEVKEEVKGFFQSLKDEKAKAQPVDIASVKLTLIAEGRLIATATKDGKDILVSKSGDGGEYSYNVYLARINGKWVVAR